MSHTVNAANQGLLAYGITTNPDPIQASPAQGNPSLASIVITVSNNTMKPIYCNKLTFSFPIGDLAQDLASTSKGILVAANPSNKWQISMTSDGVFTATPVSPADNLITTDGLSFQIFNIQANTQVGTFTLSVIENSSTDNKTFSDKTNAYDLAKFPYGFYVNNFAASAPMVQDNNPVTLTWNGSDLATYTILYGTQTVDVTNQRTWTSPSLTDTTTFALKASAQEQGETVDAYLYVTVIVADPDIVANSLTVINGTNAAQIELNAPTTPGHIGIGSRIDFLTGGVTNNLANVSIEESWGLNLFGTLQQPVRIQNADLQVCAGNATINGALNVSGTTTLGKTIINGQLGVPGTLSVVGVAQSINPGTYTAPTDGFAIGIVNPPGNNMQICRTLIWCSATPGTTVTAQGGNYTAFFRWDGSSGTAWLGGLQNSCTLPVSQGASFSVSVWNDGNNEINAPTYFYWVPMGTGNVQALERTGDALPIPGLTDIKMTTQTVSRPPDMHDLDIADLLAVLDDILGEHLDESKRSKLQNAIRRIVYFETKKHK